MLNVFVSYSTQDLENVEILQKSLSGTGVNVFVSEHSVKPSDHLSEKISDAINNCDLFVLLWSQNAKASEWVSQEIGKAHSLDKRILPLILTKGLNLPGFISGLKYIPVHENLEGAMNKAKKIILDQLQIKQDALEKKKQNDTLVLIGIGAFLLWAFSQK